MNNYYSGGMPQPPMGASNPYPGMGNPYSGNMYSRSMSSGYSQQNPHASSNAPLPVGWILNGRYTIVNVLGKGSFSFVYLALDGYSQVYTAIKELYVPGLCGRRTGSSVVELASPDNQQQFGYLLARYAEEYAAVRSLAGEPRVVDYYDLFYENNTAYIVMEYIRGMSVRGMTESSGGRMTPVQVQNIVSELLTGLSSIHEEGYLHRDIKPENVIITQDGSIKIIDFGAARLSDKEADDSELKYDKVFTQGYAPPEQFADSRRQGPETDVYAAGALCYYMLSGQIPCPSMDRKMSSYDPLKPLGMIRSDIPQYMIKAIDRAMELKPELRFRSAAAFSRGLIGRKKVKSADQIKRSKIFRRTVFAAAIIAALACAASIFIDRLIPNPVRDLITSDVRLAVIIPVDHDPNVAEIQKDMWEDICDDFCTYVEDQSGHSAKLEITYAAVGSKYTQEVQKYASDNNGGVIVAGNSRYHPDIRPDNCLPDFSSLIDPTTLVIGSAMNENSTGVPVSFDTLVLYINEKLLSSSGWQEDLPDSIDRISEIIPPEGIVPLMTDELIYNDYSRTAMYSSDPLEDFCKGKAVCYIGFAGDADIIERELPGYCSLSPLPDFDAEEHIFPCEWGVLGNAAPLELNAAQVFLAFLSSENTQEILCIRNNGGFPANSNTLQKYLDYYPQFEDVINQE